METENKPAKPLLDRQELNDFYRLGLPQFVKILFLDPINGTYSLFLNRTDKTYFYSLVLMGSTALLYVILPYIMMGGALREMLGFSVTLKLGIAVIIFMLLVSAVAFGAKLVLGKADFRNELLTGGLCGIPLVALLLCLFVTKIVVNEDSFQSLFYNPARILDGFGILILFTFYLLLLLINILQQSLRAGRANNTLSWYVAPLGILLAFYVTAKLAASFF